MTKSLAALTAIVLASAVNVSGALAAGQATIDANQEVQRQRIEQGRYNGQLTRQEYRQLNAEQARIEAMERRAQADGYISKREYKQIHDAQIEAYRHIRQESTDNQVSGWRRWMYLNRY